MPSNTVLLLGGQKTRRKKELLEDRCSKHRISSIVLQGAHWAAHDSDGIEVSTNAAPAKSPVAYVHPRKYADYALRPDLAGAARCLELLRGAGIAGVRPNDAFDWIHDTYLILIRMFPGGCPPTTIVSMNPRFDPHYHMRVGRKQTSVSFLFPSIPGLFIPTPIYLSIYAACLGPGALFFVNGLGSLSLPP